VIAFLIHVQISNRLAHQDCGLSGDPYVTLPNGYVLGSLNTYSGYIKAPGYETGGPVAGPGYVRSIIDLNFSDPYFVGTQFDHETSSVRSFVFDTRKLEKAVLWTLQVRRPLRRGEMRRRMCTPILILIGSCTTDIAIAGRNTCFGPSSPLANSESSFTCGRAGKGRSSLRSDLHTDDWRNIGMTHVIGRAGSLTIIVCSRHSPDSHCDSRC
jgi:hypothetical protein